MIVVAAGGPFLAAGLARAARRVSTVDRARRVAGSQRWRMPDRLRRLLSNALERADVAWDPELAIEIVFGGTAVVVLAVFAVAPPLMPAAVVLALGAGPGWLWVARHRRRGRMVAALPGLLERVAADLRGGGTVGRALADLTEDEGPLAPDLAFIEGRVRLGASLADALSTWARLVPVRDVRVAAGALAMVTSVGGRGASALEGLAASLRARCGAAAEARALATQARLSAWVVGAAPLAFLAFSSAVDPSSMRILLASGVGRACLGLGFVLEGIAAWWMGRIVRVEV